MILCDADILARLQQGDLKVTPIVDERMQIQPAGIDLRLGNDFILYTSRDGIYLDPRHPETIQRAGTRMSAKEGEVFILDPGQFALGATIEEVTVPTDLSGQLNGRSSLGRVGVLVHVTAGFIDPGFNGQITLELYNICPLPVILYPGMRIAQLILYQMTRAAERPYGPERGSAYQGDRGPQASRLKV